jgi:conjugal transfer/entry exclusion protein
MKNLFKSMVAAVAVGASLLAAPAYALFGVGDIVIDPTNLIQNTSSAISAVKNEINTANAYYNQIQQLLGLAKQLQSVNGLANLAGAQQEMALYQQLANVSNQLLGVLNKSNQLNQTVQAQVGASSMDWKTFLTTKSDINKSRSDALASQYAAVNQNMIDVSQRRQAIVTQLQNSTGETSAMQGVGAGVDVLIGQNQQMLATLRAQGQDALIQRSNDANSADAAEQDMIARQKRLSDAASKYK